MRSVELHAEVPGLDRLDALEGPALALEDGQAQALVQGALERLAVTPAADLKPARGRVVRFPGGALVGGAVIAMATAAAATQGLPWIAMQWSSRRAVVSAPLAPPRVAVRPKTTPPLDPEVVPAEPTLPPPVVESAPPIRVRPAPMPKRAPVTPRPISTPRARDLLAAASRLRGAQRYDEALALYLQIVGDYPATLQARVSRVAAADLQLEHFNDASNAAALPGGASVPASTNATTDGNTYTGTGCLAGDTACSNCVDDDGDGLMDAFDPECTGPLDDDERTFATGIPGDNRTTVGRVKSVSESRRLTRAATHCPKSHFRVAQETLKRAPLRHRVRRTSTV